MKPLNHDELVSAVPVMTRKERLLRWADLIRKTPHRMALVHNLEFWPPYLLAEPLPRTGTPFDLAASDPTFRKMGLGNSVKAAMDFFQLTMHQLHEFSCDCGGEIDNERMAGRIEGIAT